MAGLGKSAITPYFFAMSRHQGWFAYFSADPVAAKSGKKRYSANLSRKILAMPTIK